MGHSSFRLQYRELAELVAGAQAAPSDDTREMNEIISRFEPLVIKLSKKYTASYDLQQDLANAARFALTRAVRRHDLTLAGFGAYAERFMSGAVLRTWKQIRNLGTVDFDVVLVDFDNPEAEVLIPTVGFPGPIDSWGDGDTADVISELKPEQRLLLHKRYIEDAGLKTIADEETVSVSAVAQRLKTTHRLMSRALAA